ncbi:MAG: translation initiation factor IF-2 subunit alpha, partial [Thermoprotei archaeon]
YKLDIEALNYKTAEKVLKEILKVTESTAKKEGCSYTFQRIKK